MQNSILIVDDEKLNLDMLSRRLSRSGFAVEVASSGRMALAMVQQKSYDLILLDQMMPEMSGADVLHQLRQQYSPEALPVVMVTAVAESDRIALAMDAGANDYITKPVDYQVALARIRSQLARKHSEEVVRRSEERYALAARASREGLWDWNLQTDEIYFSPRWKEMLGLQNQLVEGRVEEWFGRILGADRQAVLNAIDAHVKGEADALQCSYRMLGQDGAVRWMSCHGMVMKDRTGKAVRLAGSQTDVTEEKTRDALTGMPNRLSILGDLESVMTAQTAAGGNSSRREFALLFLDLDGFKAVNDTLGHDAGDALVIAIARRLERLTGNVDGLSKAPVSAVAARVGGDEFTILLKSGATQESLRTFAESIQETMKVPYDLLGHTIHCAFSIGGAMGTDLHTTPEELLREADVAMYIAKRKGRGQFAIFEPGMHQEAVQQLELEQDIRQAVERNEFEIYYQPKVNLSDGRTYGVEALLRWNHPTRGLLQPDSFIRLAETTGIIVEIGKLVRENACRQVSAWNQLFPARPPLELSLNISALEFKQVDLVEQVEATLLATSFPNSSLHLEITESSLFEDLPAARKTMYALKALGIRLDIDDFGSGYSSLSYLRELPFDLLKIDRSFIGGLDPNQPSSSLMIESILVMARNLGLQVVAEGIETLAHSRILQDLGCLLGQGYFYSKPINAAKMEIFLSSDLNATLPVLTPPVFVSPASTLRVLAPPVFTLPVLTVVKAGDGDTSGAPARPR